MKRRLSISGVGWSLSAILAVIYVLVMLASLLLVGLVNTGSLQAVFLGIGWNLTIGFELGLLGIMLISFAAAWVFVTIYRLIQYQGIGQPIIDLHPNQSPSWAKRSRSTKLVVACFVLPALTLILLRVMTPIITASTARGAQSETTFPPDREIQLINLSRMINTPYREAEPSFTADGRTMYYNCNNLDICFSHLTSTWEASIWTPPEVVGAPISTEYDEVEPMISPAGDKLYFNSNRPEGKMKGIPFLSPLVNLFEVVNTLSVSKSGASLLNGLGMGHVWVSYRVNGVWGEPRPLNEVPGEPPVNSAFHDHCFSLSTDGNEAFWTSTRPGGFGGNDIWTSHLVNGQWTAPENLGAKVNGTGDEHHSMLTPDGRALFVTSNQPGGYGGEDIYITTRGGDGKWGPLFNLGAPINGSGDDRCVAWTPDFKILLFDSVREGGSGSLDLWWINSSDVYKEVPKRSSVILSAI